MDTLISRVETSLAEPNIHEIQVRILSQSVEWNDSYFLMLIIIARGLCSLHLGAAYRVTVEAEYSFSGRVHIVS